VYVLGAGASVHAGAPMLRDFLSAARLVSHVGSPDVLPHYEDVAAFLRYLDGLRSIAYYVDTDLDNVEEVFSLLEMGKQLGRADCAELIRKLKWTIYETLDNYTQVRWAQGHQLPDNTYTTFVRHLVELNKERAAMASIPGPGTIHDTVVTFNYDILLDHALHAAGTRFTYGLEGDGEGDLQLLKLHGSLNWGVCSECRGSPQVVSPASDAWIGPARAMPGEGQQLALRMATRMLPGTKCAKCDKVDKLEPLIVPPTWSKLIEGSHLVPVWNRAVEAISMAYQVVIIGYSMPSTDTFLRYLFSIALERKGWFNRVVVVNKDNSDGLRQRYRDVFGRSLGSRGKLQFVESAGEFVRFVLGPMLEVGRNM